MRVAVIDSSSCAVDFYPWAFSGVPDFELVGIYNGGGNVVSTIVELHPDIVLLDGELTINPSPSDILKEIQQKIPNVGILAIATSSPITANVLLSAGAFDIYIRPKKLCGDEISDIIDKRDHHKSMLLLKLRAYSTRRLSQITQHTFGVATANENAISSSKNAVASLYEIVAVGVSTGGPEALATFVGGIPEWFTLPVVITIHMPKDFTLSLAKNLAKISKIPVTEAIHNELLCPGHIYISPGGRHCGISKGQNGMYHIVTNDDPPENACKPSVDVLFRSVCSCMHERAIVVMLTGMGNDGFKGYKELKNAGAYTIAQDEATSVVWGMPGAVVEAGLACEVLPLKRIAPRIAELYVEKK